MDYHPILCRETPEGATSECFDIKQGDKNYKLNIILLDEYIESSLSEENLFLEIYEKKHPKTKYFQDFLLSKNF